MSSKYNDVLDYQGRGNTTKLLMLGAKCTDKLLMDDEKTASSSVQMDEETGPFRSRLSLGLLLMSPLGVRVVHPPQMKYSWLVMRGSGWRVRMARSFESSDQIANFKEGLTVMENIFSSTTGVVKALRIRLLKTANSGYLTPPLAAMLRRILCIIDQGRLWERRRLTASGSEWFRVRLWATLGHCAHWAVQRLLCHHNSTA